MRKFLQHIPLLFFVLCGLLSSLPTVVSAEGVLPQNQALWLEKHKNTLLVRPERNYPPFDFTSLGIPNAKPKGLAVDYLELIAKKVGAKLYYFEPKPLASVLEEVKSGKEGIVMAVAPNHERQEYLYFTDPFIQIPAVIAVREDSKLLKQSISLADLSGKEVAVGDGYAVETYINENYKRVITVPVSDDEIGLQQLILGEVDALVIDIASLSYYTTKNAVDYVAIAGQTGFKYDLAFAVPKTNPEVQQILQTGLSLITQEEKDIIKDRWIHFPQNEQVASSSLFERITQNSFSMVWMVVAPLIIMLLLIIFIIRSRHTHRVALLRNTGEKGNFSSLKKKLQELEETNALLLDDIERVKELERDIKKDIDTQGS